MISKKGFSRKYNLGNYETCDFFAEGDTFKECRKAVEKQYTIYMEEREKKVDEQLNEDIELLGRVGDKK